MCLTLKKDSKELIADENIPCYKYLKSGNRSLFEKYLYIKYKENPRQELHVIIEDDLHVIFEGYHSRNPFSVRGKTHLFIIPKNTKYYLGWEEDPIGYEDNYCSETIIFVGRNNWWNRRLAKIRYGVTFKERP